MYVKNNPSNNIDPFGFEDCCEYDETVFVCNKFKSWIREVSSRIISSNYSNFWTWREITTVYEWEYKYEAIKYKKCKKPSTGDILDLGVFGTFISNSNRFTVITKDRFIWGWTNMSTTTVEVQPDDVITLLPCPDGL